MSVLLCSSLRAAATEISPLFGVGNDTFSFNVESFESQEKILEFQPNIPGLSRIGISAYGFGASYSTRADVKDLDSQKGTSSFYDFQLGYHNTQWGADVFAQNYTGFYIKNEFPSGGAPAYYVYPDLKFSHYGLMGRWAMDNQGGFSVGGLMNQSDEIKNTAGSYYVVGGYRYHALDIGGNLLPASYSAGTNPELENLRKMKVNSFNLGLGAGKYWVSSGKLFFGGLFDLIGTYGLYNYENVSNTTDNSYGTLSFNLRLGVGYAGPSFRTGLSVAGDTTTLQSPGNSFIKPSATQFLLYVRYVFR